MAAVITEDEIIRRRLLIDGDGTGDDKRINTILRTIIQWSMMEGDDSEGNATYQKIIALLHQCSYSCRKHHFTVCRNNREREHYEKLYKQIEQQINEAKEEIITCKEELKQAKIVRKNKQEYDALAKIIKKHPNRNLIGNETSNLKEEIAKLNESRTALVQKLEMRQKQFHVLIYSIQLLQQVLDADDTETTSSDVKKSDIDFMDLT